mgnify:CR=1 FL=1
MAVAVEVALAADTAVDLVEAAPAADSTADHTDHPTDSGAAPDPLWVVGAGVPDAIMVAVDAWAA